MAFESLEYAVQMPVPNPSNKVPVATLDGLSGSGKSTIAKRLAARLGWVYVDSGAWYRAATWAVLEARAKPQDCQAGLEVLSQRKIKSHINGLVSVDGVELQQELRTPTVDRAVAEVADHLPVRAHLTECMQAMGAHSNVVGVIADGRDAGTVIFPNANLKIFVDASLDTRAARRFEQQQDHDVDISLAEVKAALDRRDQRDQSRGEFAPRLAAGGALFDNNSLSVEQAVGCLLDLINVALESQVANE